MYIKSLLLDGFKSYGNRVEVNDFDPQFNAITGLNGTGKSNILDSICFVLGMTNLSHVRVCSLQELIFKQGQAGIIKATVSVTFDNRDKNQCPVGYENHDEITVTRQVVMGGKNKYLINGINVQNKRVNDLFCSVQLNVNNPHFLIMQGHITKVLNMKPPEILSMVEEAAGTRMYESKKRAAQKTIEKKDAKLRELNDIIREDIAPKLQKLQDERAQFQEYQKVVRELENLKRLYIAWKYVTAEENVKQAVSKVSEVEEDIKSKQENVKSNEEEAKQLDKQVAELNKKHDEESGNVLKELEQALQVADRSEAALGAEHAAARDALASHEKRARLLQRTLRDDSATLAERDAALEQVSSEFESYREACETAVVALAAAQERFLAISSGLEGPSESLQDQLIAAKQEASEASTRISQSAMEKKHAEQRLRALEREAESSSAQYQRDRAGIAAHEQDVERFTSQLANVNYSEERGSTLKEQVRALHVAVRQRRDAADALAARLQRCDFEYSPPEPNFDSNRVAGTVCRLVNVCDPMFCTALETAAGGRLYNVVVDTEATSRLLLQRGRLRTRVTLIPLDKITPHVLDEETVRVAQEIGGGPDKVWLALDLVSYPERVRPAVQWVFGATLVCADLETARRVTFDPRVRRRCVTLDGDVFDPAGTLSGGARVKGGSVLLQMSELRALEAELHGLQAQLESARSEQERTKNAANTYNTLKQKLEMAQHALRVANERVANTAPAQLHAEIDALRERVAELTAAQEHDKKKQSETAARARELEAKVKDIKGHREREFKKAEETLSKAKRDAAQHSGAWQQREQQYAALRLEAGELRAAVERGQRALEESDAAADQLLATLNVAAAEHKRAQDEVRQVHTRMNKAKADIAARNGDIAKLTQRKELLVAACAELQLQVKQLQYRAAELRGEAVDCQKKIESLSAEHAWIASERQYFGAAGGLYDFEARGAHEAGARLAQLGERRERLSRGLNTRAHTLLGKEEEQYQDVLRKKQIVEADRAKLVEVMAELDEKKRRTLLTACEQVNKDFGSIFKTLLTGAQARLRPPPNKTVLEGLELQVGFNGVWKEGLQELSGGQRSLMALSLVLAMLLFKPAPLYILDEVDAALDLSHTQNIGQMLREHFKDSQFIIVSLKDGMFNNANVLFRTRFFDGMSSVQRIVNTSR